MTTTKRAKAKKKAAKKKATTAKAQAKTLGLGEKVLCLRTCDAGLRAMHELARGFQWPATGYVEAPDWKPTKECGHGLHGLLWGAGEAAQLSWSADAKWLVVEVLASEVVSLDGGGKVKFPRGVVVFSGGRQGATDYIRARAPAGTIVHGATVAVDGAGTATAGYRGTATAGDGGTATAGDGGTATAGSGGTATAGSGGTATAGYGGTATAGDGGTATAGSGGTATAGYGGTATAGDGGSVAIERWDPKTSTWRKRVAEVGKDQGQLKPDTPYKLDEAGAFVEVQKPAERKGS